MSDPKLKPRIILRSGRWWASADIRAPQKEAYIVSAGTLGTGATPREAYQDWRSKQRSPGLWDWLHNAVAA